MDKMPDQKAYWEHEHRTHEGLTRIHSDKPSQPVVELARFLMESGFNPGTTHIVDTGCGTGRNSGYLGEQGFQVVGVDFVSQAIEKARKKYEKSGVTFRMWDLSREWPVRTESVDVIIDCNTTISLYESQREEMIREAHRVLKRGGYYLFYGVGPSAELNEKYPGPEPDSILFPAGRFEKRYTRDALLDAYGDFMLNDIKTVPGSDVIDGQEMHYWLWDVLFQKLS